MSRSKPPEHGDLIDARPFDEALNAPAFCSDLIRSLKFSDAEGQQLAQQRADWLAYLGKKYNFFLGEPILCLTAGRLAYDATVRARFKKWIETIEQEIAEIERKPQPTPTNTI